MNKQDVVSKVVEVLAEKDVKVTKKVMSEYVDTIFNVIADSVAAGDTVSVSGFGKFEVAERGPREGRNPATGEALHIEASKAPKFRASSTFKNLVKTA